MAGRDRKKNQASLSYECVSKDMYFAPSLTSPHPFPLAGVGDDLFEKSIIVAQNLVHKLKLNPRVAMTCLAQLQEMELVLWSMRRQIWFHRKIYSQPKIGIKIFALFTQINNLYRSIGIKLSQGEAGKDASELLKILHVVYHIKSVIAHYQVLEALKNPIDSMPEMFKELVKQASDNKIEYLDIAEEIIDSLSTRVRSYEDIVKKLCGDKKRQKCSFCGAKIEVTEYWYVKYGKKCSSVLFDPLSIRVFICDSEECQRKGVSREDDYYQLSLALTSAYKGRQGTRCDFCFLLSPLDEAHRCSICLTVMYCSKSCHKTDQVEHKEKYCIADESLTKEDRSRRVQRGEITYEKMAASTPGYSEDEISKVVEAFQFKDSKSKKQEAAGGPNINEVD